MWSISSLKRNPQLCSVCIRTKTYCLRTQVQVHGLKLLI